MSGRNQQTFVAYDNLICADCGGVIRKGDAAARSLIDSKVHHVPACPTAPKRQYEDLYQEDRY
jgi:hypothetical protein